MNRQLTKLIVIFFLELPIILYGQSLQYTGRVIDGELKSPIKNANVTKNELLTKTNQLGFFQVDAIAGDTLKINHPEYEDARIIVPSELKFTIALSKKIIIYSQDEVDQKPEPINGIDVFNKQWITYVLRLGYPNDARRKGIEGKVLVYFIVDELGQVIESGIEKGIGYGCDEVALEGFNNSNTKWTPGVKGDKKVKVRMRMPFTFRLG